MEILSSMPNKPVIIMPFHFKSVLLYHALLEQGVQVAGFFDNDEGLSGKSYSETNINVPIPSDNFDRDVTVIIYYKKFEEDIRKQLTELGYQNFISVSNLDFYYLSKYIDCVNAWDRFPQAYKRYKRALYLNSKEYLISAETPAQDLINNTEVFTEINRNTGKKRRKVLLMSACMGYTGATIVLNSMAMAIIKNGDAAVLLSRAPGDFLPDARKSGVPVLIDYKTGESNYFEELALNFDAVVVNTVVPPSGEIIGKLSLLKLPVLWWIHEAPSFYTTSLLKTLPERIGDNIHIYCVSEYARNAMLSARPDIRAGILTYGVTDFYSKNTDGIQDRGKIVMMTVGSIEQRKGQDILCKAIRMMDEALRDKCEFVIVGRVQEKGQAYEEILALKEDYPSLVRYIGEISREQMEEVLHKCDCMVCASREDPMPVFMAEAMMFYKICICSENTGTASLIQDGINGFVYGSDDPELLCEKMEYVVKKFDVLGDLRNKGRAIYDACFSFNALERNIKTIFNDMGI